MKTLTLLAALFLIIGFCTDATAMGYPHRLFGSKRATVKIAPQASRRGVVTTRTPVAVRSEWFWPGVGRLVRVLTR